MLTDETHFKPLERASPAKVNKGSPAAEFKRVKEVMSRILMEINVCEDTLWVLV